MKQEHSHALTLPSPTECLRIRNIHVKGASPPFKWPLMDFFTRDNSALTYSPLLPWIWLLHGRHVSRRTFSMPRFHRRHNPSNLSRKWSYWVRWCQSTLPTLLLVPQPHPTKHHQPLQSKALIPTASTLIFHKEYSSCDALSHCTYSQPIHTPTYGPHTQFTLLQIH